MPDIGIIQTLDSNRKLQIDTQVITLDDNLTHPYFSYIEMSKNNLSPVGSGKLFAPFATDILQYWSTYTGVVILSFNLDDLKKSTNSLSFLESHTDIKQHLNNEEYNYSLITRVHKVKQKGKEIIIYLEDIGWKFLQKVPLEFRQSYIANQSLDNAFQAICEFIGIDFAYSIDDLSQYTFGTDGYSIQKDGKTIETVETILSKWDTSSEEDGNDEDKEKDPLTDPQYENPSLIEFDNKNKDNENFQDKEKEKNVKIVEKTENQEKNEKYQEEFDQKILNLFIGNSYYEADISKALLDYNRITITPQTTTDSSTSNTNDSMITEESDNKTSDNSSSNNISSKYSGNLGAKVQTSKTKKALSYDQINSMNVKQAQHEATKTNYYYHTTIVRLRAYAAWGRPIGPNTNYSKYDY